MSSIDSALGFGLFIPQDKFQDMDGEAPDGTQFIFAGDTIFSYESYLCVLNTIQTDDGKGSSLEAERFLDVGPYWPEFFKNYAAKLGIAEPRIGWWLCASSG